MADNFFGITDTGRQRQNNEDAFIAQAILNKQLILACVIDGVGGYEGGEVAAAIAKDSILQSQKKFSTDIIKDMREAFVSANEKIYHERLTSEKNSDMACVATLAVADLRNNKFYYAHVGDTRLYLFRDHSLIKITKDQSFVGFLEDSGRLSEEEAMKHIKRNEINNALGFDLQSITGTNYIETGESPFLPGDIILLCSDGLTDMVAAKEITSILERNISLEEKGRQLIAAANHAGGKDNITAVMVQNNKRPVKQEIKKAVAVKKTVTEKPVQSTKEIAPLPAKEQAVIKERNNFLVRFLSTLCAVLFLGLIWLWWKQNASKKTSQGVVKKEHNVAEIRFQTFINASQSDTVVLKTPDWGNIYLTDTIWIRRESLYLKGGGLNLIKDSTTASKVAIMIAPECKHVELENIIFQNFNIAIFAANKNVLQLKNVQFKNCAIAVAHSFPASQNINAKFTDIEKEAETNKPLQH